MQYMNNSFDAVGLGASISTFTSTGISYSGVTVLNPNYGRRAGAVFNDGTGVLLLGYGNSMTTGIYSVKLNTNDYYELLPNYQGPILGLFLGTGSARVTEII